MNNSIDYANFIDIEAPTISNAVDLAVIESGLSRIAVCLCLDTSGSMGGTRIANLNKGLLRFQDETRKDSRAFKSTDLAIVTFDSQVNVIQDFCPLPNITMPTLSANGITEMGKGVLKSLELIEARKDFYKKSGIDYFRPMLFVISDGGDNGGKSFFMQASNLVKDYTDKHKLIAFGLALDRESDKEQLSTITNRQAQELLTCNFLIFFEWLSKSIGCVSRSSSDDTSLSLPSVKAWAGWDTV